MKLNRWIPISALILFALLLGGCINIQQEYWLYEDGSAKVSMDIGMSQALLSMGATSGSDTTTNPFDDLKSEFNDSNPNIKNVKVREYSENDLQHFEVTFEVPDFEKFLAEEASQGSEFDITLTRTPDDSILFKQTTQLDSGGMGSDMDVESMGPVFKDMYWSVIVHVPQVISTNGERLDNSTVQWKIPMADIFSGKAPGELTMVYKPRGAIGGGGIFGSAGSTDSNLGLFLIVGIVVLVIAAGAAYYFLVFRKRPAAVSAAYGSYPPPSGGQPQQGLPPQWGAQPQQGVPPQWGAQPQQGPPPQWNGQPQQGPPPQWDGQPPQAPPPQYGAPPPQAENLPPQWNAPPQPGTPETYPQQQPPQQPPAQYNQTPPQPPDYPAYPQYTQPPAYPPGPAQGSDYYPPYPPQQPPAAQPPVEPPPDPPEQS